MDFDYNISVKQAGILLYHEGSAEKKSESIIGKIQKNAKSAATNSLFDPILIIDRSFINPACMACTHLKIPVSAAFEAFRKRFFSFFNFHIL